MQSEPLGLAHFTKLDPSRCVALVRALLERAAATSGCSIIAAPSLAVGSGGPSGGSGGGSGIVGRCATQLQYNLFNPTSAARVLASVHTGVHVGRPCMHAMYAFAHLKKKKKKRKKKTHSVGDTYHHFYAGASRCWALSPPKRRACTRCRCSPPVATTLAETRAPRSCRLQRRCAGGRATPRRASCRCAQQHVSKLHRCRCGLAVVHAISCPCWPGFRAREPGKFASLPLLHWAKGRRW